MTHHKLILFDFDGVIIDGINEYWISSLLACQKYLNSHEIINNRNFTTNVSKTFIEMRPWVKYGWEMVIITHEIIKSKDPLNRSNKGIFLENYQDNCQRILKINSWKSDTIQQYLNDARKLQIATDLEKWISLHEPFAEIIRYINYLIQNNYKIGIISTKGREFTKKILNKINIFPELIFGYEAGSKIDIIATLSNQYNILAFIEDRRKTLTNILENEKTKHIPCFLADWGYLKKKDRFNLPKEIKLIRLNKLEEILAK